MFSTRKINCSEKNNFENFGLKFKKNRIFACSFFIIDDKMMVSIANESAEHS